MAGSGPLDLGGLQLVGKSGPIKDFNPKDFDCIGLYFSAHWCPPCRGFTPMLAQWYNNAKAAGQKLEIIFVSSDRDEEAFNEYYKEMPWLALKFSERESKNNLSGKYGVSGIPTLVILDNSGNTKTINGRGPVQKELSENNGYSGIPKWS